MNSQLIRRNVESVVKDTLNDTPVTVIQGARQVGKSTLAKIVSNGLNCRSVTLDSHPSLAAAKENPYEFVSQYPDGLLIIDEIQRCPELINAIKLSVDRNRKPGRFLITGSANLMSLKGTDESLAGRAETIVLEPFSIGEIKGKKEDFISLFINKGMTDIIQATEPLTRAEYTELIVCGGYPDARNRTEKRRKSYFKNYISRVLDHDANELSGLTHLDKLQNIYTLLAANPTQIYNRANVSRLVGIPESSMNGYIRLLDDLSLLHTIPAWGSNYSKRALSRPKIILSDTGLVTSHCGLSGDFLSNIENGNALGSILETFVATEIIKQQSWSDTDYTLFHYRDSDKKEVDLVIELYNGKIIALEIKASSSFSKSDFNNLKTLRDISTDRFHAGILLYTGTEVQPFGENLFAAPISSIWL